MGAENDSAPAASVRVSVAIPTCVGTTTPSSQRPSLRPVHPHVRGDNDRAEGLGCVQLGPSPRAWGQRLAALDAGDDARSIPTCVGTTPLNIAGMPQIPVHPHVRGDNGSASRKCSGIRGPSPRAWGQLRRDDAPEDVHRSIPTCVGTTHEHRVRREQDTVHPHVRGDNVILINYSSNPLGPSPRAWGQRSCRRHPAFTSRSIPTCVGTTSSIFLSTRRMTVHPHVRGDNRKRIGAASQKLGPSPRAWGQPLHALRGLRSARSIPTCVGTTLTREQGPSPAPVHPHVRGDNARIRGDGGSLSGPSPRAWGQQSHPVVPAYDFRSIPTCVGTT